jgi:hypothetical protein
MTDITRGVEPRKKLSRCEHCSREMPTRSRGAAGRKKRFCSDACRKSNSREELSRWCPEIESKTLNNSSGYKAKNGHLYPSPLDVLGGGHAWPQPSNLDRATWEKILWREVCAP